MPKPIAPTDPAFNGRATLPVVWDKEARRIVNNSEDDICRMFDGAFRGLATHAARLSLTTSLPNRPSYPSSSYRNVNNGVYRAGFATRQAAYERAAHKLFAALDELEIRLTKSRYLFGDRIVESDWRLFCTLIRFDVVYYVHFKCSLRRILDYPNLQGYLADLYQQPGIAATVTFDHIKRHYYMTHEALNPTRLVPIGPILDLTQAMAARGFRRPDLPAPSQIATNQ